MTMLESRLTCPLQHDGIKPYGLLLPSQSPLDHFNFHRIVFLIIHPNNTVNTTTLKKTSIDIL